MLLIHKRTGNVYAYNKVLWDSGDYKELVEEQKNTPVAEPEKKIVRRKTLTLKVNGEKYGTDAK